MRPSVWGRSPRFRRSLGGLAFLIVLLALAAAGAIWTSQTEGPITGKAIALDGDTLRIAGKRIRLLGIDAVEAGQHCTRPDGQDWACGTVARDFVAHTIKDQPLTCAPSGRDFYGRTLARCLIGTTDLAQQVVAAGWAVSQLDYLADEAAARAAGRGIWSGTFVAPADWRRGEGNPAGGLWGWIRAWFQ